MNKKHLLAINVYDKYDWVDAWVKQFEKLDKDKWKLQIVCNGPNPKRGWVIAGNNDQTSGYKQTLAATVVDEDIDVVVSVHAKTALSDIRHLDALVDILNNTDEADAMFSERELYNYKISTPVGDRILLGHPAGEYLFLFLVKAKCWNALIKEFASDMSIGTEVGMAQSIDKLQLNVIRSPCFGPNISMTSGERALFGINMQLNAYGCERTHSNMNNFEVWSFFGMTPFYNELRIKDVTNWFNGV